MAMDAEPSLRQAILDDAKITDEVRSEVASLLAFEDAAADFMSLPIAEYAKDFLFSSNKPSSFIGRRVGAFEVVDELGSGGMGAVFLGRRVDGKFEQAVALKMLRQEFNIKKIRRYFKRESEIQGTLGHSNIARLFDVGMTEDGIPFFAMEYVEGVAVDKHCENNDLSIKERLILFTKICQAVAHAHRNMIIHRDLKPSNIIVNADGEPKLLDFGISTLLNDQRESEDTVLTAISAMTPEYASPEQMRGENLSTATDIYSLGVVLYKMLTNGLPYDLKGKSSAQISKIVLEEEPLLPSAIQDPRSKIHGSMMTGDLDNIILKTLRKDPERRYDTVEELIADIWRHLDGLPVLARPATVSYRASKYFRRHKISVIASSLILLSLIGGIAASFWYERTARAAQINAENNFLLAQSEEARSEKEREKSEKISRFMFKVFSYADPTWYAEGNKTRGQARVLDALEDLSIKIDSEFEGNKDIQAELHHRFSEVFSRVATYNTEPDRQKALKEKSILHVCRGLDLRRQFYGDHHELVAKDLYYGAGCIANTEAGTAAVWDRSINMFRATNTDNLNYPYILTDYATRLAMPEHSDVHDAFHQAVSPATNETKYEVAERYYREALRLFRTHYSEINIAIYSAECRFSYVLAIGQKWGEFDEHFSVCRESRSIVGNDAIKVKLNSMQEIIEKLHSERHVSNVSAN